MDSLTTLSTQGCKLLQITKTMTAVGSIAVGGYDIYKVFEKNYEKYVVNGESVNAKDVFFDVLRVTLDATLIAGGIKLAQTDMKLCFIAGTLVVTAEGRRVIEEIQIGDEVVSMDYETGEVAVKKVTETFENEAYELVHVYVNGEVLSATPEHPFYVDKFGWTLAGNLRAGDVLVLVNGEYVVVELVQHEILENPVLVYNFTVEDYHTYFVGESGFYTHNACKPEINRKQAFNEAKDRAGVPRSQQPTKQWQVGDDITKKGANYANYKYDSNPGSHGRYYEFNTPKGKRVVVDHVNDGVTHMHAGRPKPGANHFTYDFKVDKYQNIPLPNTNHHIYYGG
jgi:hypothetical protein